MLLRKEQGNCAIGDYVWEKDGDVVEVPDWMGEELLAIQNGGYTEVLPHTEKHESNEDWEPVKVPDGHWLADGEEEPVLDYVSENLAENLKLLARFQEEAKEVPDGTANQVLDWVGDDRKRANLALIVEKAKGVDARSTLVARLTKLAS